MRRSCAALRCADPEFPPRPCGRRRTASSNVEESRRRNGARLSSWCPRLEPRQWDWRRAGQQARLHARRVSLPHGAHIHPLRHKLCGVAGHRGRLAVARRPGGCEAQARPPALGHDCGLGSAQRAFQSLPLPQLGRPLPDLQGPGDTANRLARVWGVWRVASAAPRTRARGRVRWGCARDRQRRVLPDSRRGHGRRVRVRFRVAEGAAAGCAPAEELVVAGADAHDVGLAASAATAVHPAPRCARGGPAELPLHSDAHWRAAALRRGRVCAQSELSCGHQDDECDRDRAPLAGASTKESRAASAAAICLSALEPRAPRPQNLARAQRETERVLRNWPIWLRARSGLDWISQGKTAVTMLGGYLFFDGQPNARQLFGAALALTSLGAYSYGSAVLHAQGRSRLRPSEPAVTDEQAGDTIESVQQLEKQPLRGGAAAGEAAR